MKPNFWWEPSHPDPKAEPLAETIAQVTLTTIGVFLVCTSLWLILIAWLIENAESHSGLLGSIGTFEKPNRLFLFQWALLCSFGVLETAFILAMTALREPGSGTVAAMFAAVLSLCAIWSRSFQQILPAVVFIRILPDHGFFYLSAVIQTVVGLVLVFANKTIFHQICSRLVGVAIPKRKPIYP